MEINFGVFDNIGRHTGKRDRQVTSEIKRISKTHAKLTEQLGQILTLNDTTRILVTLAESQAGIKEIGILFLAVAETLVAKVFFVSDDIAPVLHPHHRVERIGIVADGIEATDDTTHRRARDDVNGDIRLLQHFQYTDVSHTLCTAATQYDSHLFSLFTHTIVLCVHRADCQHSSYYQ